MDVVMLCVYVLHASTPNAHYNHYSQNVVAKQQ